MNSEVEKELTNLTKWEVKSQKESFQKLVKELRDYADRFEYRLSEVKTSGKEQLDLDLLYSGKNETDMKFLAASVNRVYENLTKFVTEFRARQTVLDVIRYVEEKAE